MAQNSSTTQPQHSAMERIIWVHQSDEPFYVFDETYAVHFWDDGVSIHGLNEGYKDPMTRFSPFGYPQVYPRGLDRAFYKGALLNLRLPLTITLEGANLGTVKLVPGLDRADFRAEKRRIVTQYTKLELAADHLAVAIRLATAATPGESATSDETKSAQEFGFNFQFPLDLIPEVLNMTDGERRGLQQIRGQA